MPWKRRPQSLALLQAPERPDREFEAFVIGEPARAFYGKQFGDTFPLFTHYNVSLWVPEVGGEVDPGLDAHDLLMQLYGGMSKGERNRIKVRVKSAMVPGWSTTVRLRVGRRGPSGWRAALRCRTRVFPPEVLDDAHRQGASELLFEPLAKRRLRNNPRAVKRKMSNYGVKRPEHRNQPPPPKPEIRFLSAKVDGIGAKAGFAHYWDCRLLRE